ncbi:MAG: glycosyltransferase, partial [Deltaproteobacteria bacterium]|nr:glycosyltransferase [Deltaproteobacteria bacterium]
MRYKILIDPHPFLESVLNSLQDRYDVELLSLSSAIQHYGPQCTTVSYTAPSKLNLKNDTLSGFPSWFTENTSTVEHIVIQSLKEQLIKYGPWIEAMDLCLQNEDISLILLWNDVTALTKSLTILGKRYGVPSLHVSHGIPVTAEAHGKIWADKIAVFGDSSRVFYLANGNQQEKIVITGNPYWDNWGPCSSRDVKKIKGTLGLKDDKKVVMFAPTWYHNFRTANDPELKVKRDLEILLDTMSQLKLVDKVNLLVKLHGGHKDKAAFYDRNIKSRGFSYKIIAEASPLPLIQVSDVVLCAGSMVVEAILAGKPIIYNVCDQFESEQHFNFFMSHSFTLDKAPFYVALNRDDLSRDLNRALNNCDDFSTEEIKKFLHRQNGPCDGKATERVADLTIEMAVNNKNKEKRVKFISPVSYHKRETYYSNIREDIPSIITGNPQRILEVGCAEGVMGAFLKKKYNCEYVGVEINSEAAHKAEKRLDHIVIADVEKANLKEHRIAETGFDYIIYGDVLEHLYDPWTVIFEHKKLLRENGYVVVSIPNVRNLKIIDSLVNGNWTYKDEGILDSTHLRFFTLQEIKKMFINCGYDIVDIKCITNPIFDLSKIQGQVNIDLPKMTIKNVSQEEMSELSTVQFIVKAQKATVSESGRHPKCSIIIPIFNQAEYTRQCIEALYKNTSSSFFEVIVVDNNSTDGTKDYLSSIPEKVKVITNNENLGFAKACNQGAEHSKGYYLIFLNNDTLPQHGWLEEMINTAEKDSLVGMVGSRLLYPDGTIQHAGVYFNEHGIPYHAFRSAPGDHPAALITRETPGVTGACMLMPKQLFQHIGGFNEDYHMYVEDVDLCLRTWDVGFKVVYCAESVLTHFESASITDIHRRDAQVREAWDHLHKSWRNKWPMIIQKLTPDDTSCRIDLNSDPKRNDNTLKELKVMWHTPIYDPSGYADEARNLILQLQSLNIEPAVREIGRRSDVFRNGVGEQERVKLDEAIAQEILEDFISIIQFPAYAFERIPLARYHIGRTTFETNGLPADWIQKCNLMDEIWVPSEFNMQTFKAAGVTSKLFKIPEGVNV